MILSSLHKDITLPLYLVMFVILPDSPTLTSESTVVHSTYLVSYRSKNMPIDEWSFQNKMRDEPINSVNLCM